MSLWICTKQGGKFAPIRNRALSAGCKTPMARLYNSMTTFDAKRETANLLGEEAESRSLHKRLWQKEQQTHQERPQQRKKKNKDLER